MQQTMVETNQQLIEACAKMKKIMTHFNEPVSITNPDQVQEFYQLPQVDFNSNHEGKQPTFEEPLENLRQVSQ